MKILTSIAPKHANGDIQLQAVRSWKRLGEVYSFNHPDEIHELKKIYGNDVRFIPTLRTHEAVFGKPYVLLSALFDYAKEQTDFCAIINSDCVLNPEASLDWILEKVKEGFVYLHRWDHEGDYSKSKQYKLGIDGFFFAPSIARDLPQTTYALGHCYFDIAYPYFATQAGYRIFCYDKSPVLMHLTHSAQYKSQDWEYFGKYTAFLLNKVQRPHDISQFLYGALNERTEYASKSLHKVL